MIDRGRAVAVHVASSAVLTAGAGYWQYLQTRDSVSIFRTTEILGVVITMGPIFFLAGLLWILLLATRAPSTRALALQAAAASAAIGTLAYLGLQ